MISFCLPFHHSRSSSGRFHCQHEHCLYIFSWVYVWSLNEYTLSGSICHCTGYFRYIIVKIRHHNRVKPNIIHAVWADYFYILNPTGYCSWNDINYIQCVPLATEPSWLADRCSVSQQLGALQTHSFSFLTQRTYSCSNFVAISSLVLELLKKCRVL